MDSPDGFLRRGCCVIQFDIDRSPHPVLCAISFIVTCRIVHIAHNLFRRLVRVSRSFGTVTFYFAIAPSVNSNRANYLPTNRQVIDYAFRYNEIWVALSSNADCGRRDNNGANDFGFTQDELLKSHVFPFSLRT